VKFDASYGPDAGLQTPASNAARAAYSMARRVKVAAAKGGDARKMIICRALADSKVIASTAQVPGAASRFRGSLSFRRMPVVGEVEKSLRSNAEPVTPAAAGLQLV
jgi:hypothetical protein